MANLGYTPERVNKGRAGALRLLQQSKGKAYKPSGLRTVNLPWAMGRGPEGPTPDYSQMASQVPDSFVAQGDFDLWRERMYPGQFDQQGKPATPIRGPQGQDLPPGAIAWDYFGEPWFGGGLKGLVARFIYKVKGEDVEPPDQILSTKMFTPQHRPGYPAKSVEIVQLLPTLRNIWQSIYSRPNMIGATVRGAQFAVGEGLAALGEVGKKTEQIAAVEQELGQIGEESGLPAVPRLPQQLGQRAVEAITGRPMPQGAKDASQMPWNVSPGGVLYNAMRAALAPGTVGQKMDRLERAWYSGRILYSSFADAALRAEYDRRYQAGENPYLLAQELENPMAELAGTLLVDPFIGIGVGGKTARANKYFNTARKLYATIPDEIGEALRVAGTLEDARTLENAENTVAAIQAASRSADAGLNDYAKAVGWYTADAKKFQMGVRAREVMGWIVHEAPNPDDQVEALHALVQLASDDPDDVAKGFAFAAHFPSGRPFFSQAGMEVGRIMRSVLQNEDGVVDTTRFLDELKKASQKGTAEVVKLAVSRMEPGVARMFPTVTERIARGEAVPAWQRALAKSEKAMRAVYRVPNSFFAGVYMGLSPGYASRNLMTNSLHIAVDQGISALFTSPTKAIQNTADMLKGQVPASMGGFGRGLAGIDVAEILKGKKLETPASLGKAVKERAFLGASEKFEEWGAAQTIWASVKRSFNKMFKEGRAIPETAPLQAAGYSPAASRRLVQLVIDNKGDVDKAVDVFRAEMKTGSHPLFRDLSILTEQDRVYLSGFDKTDEVLDALTSSRSAEEAAAKIRGIFDNLAADARKVADDMPLVSESNPGMPEVMAAVGDLTDTELAEISKYYTASDNAIFYFDDAIEKAIDGKSFEMASTMNPALSQQITDMRGLYAKTKLARNALRQESQVFAEKWGNKFKTHIDGQPHTVENMAQWWDEIGMTSTPPTTWSEFKSRYWNEFYYQTRHDTYYKPQRELLEEVARAVQAQFGTNPQLEHAFKMEDLAKYYDEHVIDYQRVKFALSDAIAKGDNAEAARLYAQTHGIPTITEKGAYLDDRLLATYNKYRPKGTNEYGSLAEILPDDARSILARRAAVKKGLEGATPEATEAAAKAVPGETSNIRVGISNVEGYEENAADAVYNTAKQLRDQGDIAGFESGAKNAVQYGIDYVTRATQKFLNKAAFTWGRFEWGSEPSIYYVGNVTEQELPEFLYRMAKTGDDVFKQNDVLLYESLGTETREVGKFVSKAGLRYRVEPMATVKFKTPLTDEQLKILDEVTNQVGLAGYTLTPEKDGIEIIRVEKYNEGHGAEEFANQLKEWARVLSDREILGDIQLGYGRSWLLTKGNADDAARWGGYNYQEYYDHFETLSPEAAGRIRARVAEIPYAGNMPTPARVIHEQLDGLDQLFTRIEEAVRSNWGSYEPVRKQAGMEAALKAWAKEGNKRASEARLMMSAVADLDRNFTMLSYPEKSYLDIALSYIYPYHFWYTHTYANWVRRIASSPEVLYGYARYKDAMAKVHAGAPEWWKYNINTNELLGLDSENPLYFNLEQSLNPLQGLTGVDFTDKYKRINWWTSTLDDMGKMGPSTWTPFSLATAIALKVQGEEEAAARWGGRLFPQTATLKSLLTLAGAKVKTGKGINEFDPAVWAFSGGLDPYERNRAGRALGTIMDERGLTPAEIDEAAFNQDSPLWYEAVERAIRQRGWGQLASFAFGTGFKTRNETDMQVDRMYSDWYRLWNQKDELSPEMFQQATDQMRAAYPWMDAVMISRKGTEERDRSYAYNVLSRIPPGQKDDIAEALGIPEALLSKFWESKGDMEGWTQTDQDRFMSGMVDIGALYEMPSSATQAEWREAQAKYKQVKDAGEDLFGADIWDRVNVYFSAKSENGDRTQADAILQADPQISEALDWQTQQYTRDPLLAKYYTSLRNLEYYYNGQMYRSIENIIGMPIDQMFDEYNYLKLTDKKAASAYYKKYIQEYYDWKDTYEKLRADAIIRISGWIDSPLFPELRPGGEGYSIGTQAVTETMRPQPTVYDYSWNEWRQMLSPPLQNLVMDYARDGDELPQAAEKQLEYIAEDLGISDAVMLQLIVNSLGRQ